MIVEFSVANYRSIHQMQTISFLATKQESNQELYPEVDKNNIFTAADSRLLKTVGLYGANASGKSNILQALRSFLFVVSKSPSPDSFLNTITEPFLYQENAENTESFFQIVLIIEGEKYRYGFTAQNTKINNGSKDIEKKRKKRLHETTEVITAEWLFWVNEQEQTPIFTRLNSIVTPSNEKIPALPYNHSLYLTQVASYVQNNICTTIRDYISNNFVSLLEDGAVYFRDLTLSYLEENETKQELLDFLSEFKIHFDDIEIEDKEINQKQDVFPRNKIFVAKYNKANTTRLNYLNLEYLESEGTKKLFDLAGVLLVFFNNMHEGGLIIIDELDSNFHPQLVRRLIEMFNNPEINKSNAQLLFSSHDTNLLDPALLRRDQIYFAEKDSNDATKLYSLVELRGIKNDADFARQYLAGIYGAVPNLRSLTSTKSE